jgi:Type IX secretion system protein PorV
LKKILITSFLIILCGSLGYSQFNKSGKTALQFLKIGMGAREAALGEATVASTNDVNAIFWNPAGIAGIQGAEASFNYTQWIGDINVLSGAVGYNWDGVAAIVVNYITLDYGNLQEALVTSSSGGIDTRTGNTFSGSDLSIGVGIARRFTDRLSIGAQVKYLREDLFTYSSDVWAFDIGTTYSTGWYGVNIAMTAQNFSEQARWINTGIEEDQNFEVPRIFKIGLAVDLLGGEDLLLGGNYDQHRLALNVDAVNTNDYSERLHFGAEYTFYNIFTLRGGYRLNYEEGNLSAGAGVQYDFGYVRFKFDYAYVSYDFLQSPHRFTIFLGF